MSNIVHEEEYWGYGIEIAYDEDTESPREWDNFGHMVCFHKKYSLGDKHDVCHEDFDGWEEMEEYLRKERGAFIILPLYLYDHSGITMSTSPFGCRRDSGQVGFTYCTEREMLDTFAGSCTLGEIKERAEKLLRSEVKTYDQYLRGEVYGFLVKGKDGEEIDSCWGYYEGYEYVLKEAKRAVDAELAYLLGERLKKLKRYIQYRVPFEQRFV
ncbi:MAG: hypothetical protein KKB59_18855 [Spirochaetes bacterium]|nr:hypothetical protein [Spirochaetota bacterium]